MYLTDRQVAERLSISRTSVWRWVKRGAFPAPIQFSPGATRWKLADVEQWERDRAEAGAE